MLSFNLFTGPLTLDEDDPTGYAGRYATVSEALGARDLAVKLFELPPGQSVSPYHYEYVEEWLVVLAGRPTIRHPEGEQVADAGDVVCFPAGADGAHKVTNESSSETVRVIMFSSAREPAVAVYPDSDKIGIWPGSDADRIIVPRAAGVDYWEGEA